MEPHTTSTGRAIDGKGNIWTCFSTGVRALGAALLISMLVTPGMAATIRMDLDEYQADLTQTYELLKTYHPNLTAHIKRADFDRLFKDLLNRHEDRVTVDEAYLAISELVGAVCDEHTQVIKGVGSTWPAGWPWFAHPLIVEGGKLYVENRRTGFMEEVLSIDDIPGEQLAESIGKRSPSDGCLGNGTLEINKGLFLSGNVLASMLDNDVAYYVLRTRPPGWKKHRTRLVKPVSRYASATDQRRDRDKQRRNLVYHLDRQGLELQDLGPELEEAGIEYRYSAERNIAYLDVDEFGSYDDFEKALDPVMRDIIRRNPDALIIDLVDNRGGLSRSAQLLMAYLLPRSHRLHSRAHMRNVSKTLPDNFTYFEDAEKTRRKSTGVFRKVKSKRGVRSLPILKQSFGKPDYKGPIHVLVSPGSRSASLLVATNLRRLRKSTIVGSLTATDTVTSCARASGNFKLENTRFLVRVPELCYRRPESRFNEAHTLEPDIEVGPMDGPLQYLNARIARAALDDIDQRLQN